MSQNSRHPDQAPLVSAFSEHDAFYIPGGLSVIGLAVLAAALGLLVVTSLADFSIFKLIVGSIGALFFLVGLSGLKIVQPGEALVMTFFGSYSGTLRRDGFHFINPLANCQRISLRVNNLLTPTLKVNDASGNPIEVGASIAWVVADTAKALFSVEHYGSYIKTQCESALRAVVGSHPYDGKDTEKTLRGGMDAVRIELMKAIEESVSHAGIQIVDARIAHLAYAPEIASAMLKRQQAEQIVAARETIVEGAVTLVKTAMDKLKSERVIELNREEAATLVTNMMTVLVSESEAQPVLQMSSAGKSTKN